MSNTNKFEITGKVDRVITTTGKTGREFYSLVLAVGDQLVPIKLWDDTAEWKTATKGTELHVTGKLGGRAWQDKVFGDSIAETIEVAGGKQGEKQPESPADSEDLPF
jgi:hypothetical protein